jgi:hypothetical protein
MSQATKLTTAIEMATSRKIDPKRFREAQRRAIKGETNATPSQPSPRGNDLRRCPSGRFKIRNLRFLA